MRFSSGKDFLNWPHKAVTVFGMSGVGKTTFAQLLQEHDWFHYSVDYRIGTKYIDRANRSPARRRPARRRGPC